MLCLECATRAPHPRLRYPTETTAGLDGISRIRSLLCSGCGGLLPLTDTTEGLLSKLMQLDGFGLGAFTGPLLKQSRAIACGKS